MNTTGQAANSVNGLESSSNVSASFFAAAWNHRAWSDKSRSKTFRRYEAVLCDLGFGVRRRG